MNEHLITEGLDFNDMEGQVHPIITVDEYSAKMGKDSDVVTLSFLVDAEEVGNDLVDWFERGYDWVLDASISDGEVELGKYLVFVELMRRSTVPAKIVELLKDLKTLTAMKLSEWVVEIDGKEYPADEKILAKVIILNPNVYKSKEELSSELNEMRTSAGLPITSPKSQEKSSELKDYLAKAGL